MTGPKQFLSAILHKATSDCHQSNVTRAMKFRVLRRKGSQRPAARHVATNGGTARLETRATSRGGRSR